jgi:hypothetical protein
LLVAWPVLALLLGLLIHYKRYYYVLLIMPFLALQLAYAVLAVWRQTHWSPTVVRSALTLVLIFAVLEGVFGIAQSWRAARTTTRYATLSQRLNASMQPGATVLLAEPYWLGLAQYEARSIQLAFLLSDERYYADPPSLSAVLADLSPDYVVTEERLLENYGRDPDDTSANALDWRELDAYLQAHCPLVAADLTMPDYGEVKVYQCDTAAGH